MSQYKLTIFKGLIQSVRFGIVILVTLDCVAKLYHWRIDKLMLGIMRILLLVKRIVNGNNRITGQILLLLLL
jgi:hypothetical protein